MSKLLGRGGDNALIGLKQFNTEKPSKMQNIKGETVELYIPRKWLVAHVFISSVILFTFIFFLALELIDFLLPRIVALFK